MKFVNGKTFIDGRFTDAEVKFDTKGIIEIGKNLKDEEIIDLKGNYLFAGIIDPHCHGGFMRSYLKDEAYAASGNYREQLEYLSEKLPETGVTAVFPTLSGNDFDAIRESIIETRKIKDSLNGCKILKFHLEGPYVTLDRYTYPGRPEPTVSHTDWLVDNRYDDIAVISIAPEMTGAMEWIDYAVSKGVIPELCHSKADSKTVSAAADHGMILSDHLFNGLPVMHHRVSGPNEGVLLDERISTQLTCDGYHVNPDWIRLTIKIKGIDKCIGVTDLQACSGLEDGLHTMADGSVLDVHDGFSWRSDGHIKGGNSVMNEMMRRANEICGLSREEVGSLFAENTAKILNIKDRGKIEAGRVSDFVIMDEDYNVLQTWIDGQLVYKAEKQLIN